jgi:hypothetical protein
MRTVKYLCLLGGPILRGGSCSNGGSNARLATIFYRDKFRNHLRCYASAGRTIYCRVTLA